MKSFYRVEDWTSKSGIIPPISLGRKETVLDIYDVLDKAKKSGKKTLSEYEAKQFLKAFGLPMVNEIVAENEAEALEAAQTIGYPVVIKGLGETLLHKTERGLVHLNIQDEKMLSDAVKSIALETGQELDGFLVQPQLKGKREFVAGLFRDDLFGPVVMFGLGGIFAEALSDVSFRIAPLTEADAAEMIDELDAQKLLEAFRGEKPADRGQLVQTLMGLSEIGLQFAEIAEIDINPLIIDADGGVCAVDALIVMGEPAKQREFLPPVDPMALGKLFHPKSIAFVGATGKIGKWGHFLVTTTISKGYAGDIYLVNPHGGEIAGREVYSSVSEIPGPVDLAIVTIPANAVMELIDQFKEKGVRNMVLVTSGFGETGAEGRKYEKALVEKAIDAGILILGPNTMGICNPHISLYCTGTHVQPRAGSTAVTAQSGNMGTQLMAFAEQQGIGIRCFAGSGNEAMITIEDYIEGFEIDEKTQIVMLYVESVKNGRRFFESAKRIGKKKPVVLLKGGRTEIGSRAAASHTGALTSNEKVFDAVCKQTGIVKVDQPMDLLDLSAAFSSLPLPKGNRAAIMTLGGGWGVVASDLCSEYGLDVPDLSPDIIERIDQILPPYWSRTNPVDLVGENDDTLPTIILEELLKWDGCDAVINLGIIGRKHLIEKYVDSILKADPNYDPEFLKSVIQMAYDGENKYIEKVVHLMEKYGKPVYGVSLLGKGKGDQTLYRLEGHRLKGVFYPTPERAVKAFAKMVEYNRFLERG